MSRVSEVARSGYQMAPHQYRRKINKQPEIYDINSDLPDNNSYPVDDNEPELYCFEDFIPSDEPVQYCNIESIHPNEMTCLSCINNNKQRQLHRSKTLPLIHTPFQCTDEDELPGCQHMVHGAVDNAPRWSNRSPDSSEYSGSCGSESGRTKVRSRKYRVRSLSRERKSQRRTRRCSGSSDQSSAWNFEDDTDSTTSSETMTSVSDDVPIGSSQLYYTTPPKANMVRNQDDKSVGFHKVTRCLSQKDRIKNDVLQERQRSVSLDCGDGRTIKIFMSQNNDTSPSRDTPTGLLPSPSAPAQLRNMNGYQSSHRGSKILVSAKKRGSTSSDTDILSPHKMYERRRSDREKRSGDASALFEVVEQQDIDSVKAILESNTVNVNSLNAERLTPLDVAVMTNNIPMAKLLLSYGARESPMFLRIDSRSAKLDELVMDAEKRVVDLSAAILNASASSGSLSTTQQKENEKQLSHWEFRHKLLKRMKAGYDHARMPDPPSYVSLTVASSSSLLVRFDEPLNHNGAVVTKYKVEWSCFEDFMPLAGDSIVENMRQLEYEIEGLAKGNRYYVRVAAWNMKGYSPFSSAKPSYAVPSSWRDVDGNAMSRTEGKNKLMDELFSQVKHLRPPDASELKDNTGGDSPQQRKRKSIKNLFTSAPKFYKTLKRGVYLACLLYNGDKVLVTGDDQLPIVEVDENFSGPSVYNDFHWLMKVSCTWEDVKSLRQDMDKNTSAGTMHFRSKLLQAVSIMQSSLGVQDIGQFHFKPLKDPNGCIILTTVCNIKDPKTVILGSGRWISFAKLLRRSSAALQELQDSPDVLHSSIGEMILYHQVSTIPLAKGLYICYLKLQVAVDLIQVLVPRKAPNVLPYVKVRDCPNVSREEWEWLQTINADQHVAPPTSTQQQFRSQINHSTNKLFGMLEVSENMAGSHRLYDLEVMEFSNDVTFLLVLPPVEDVCIVPGQRDLLTEKRDFMLLPVQVFEMIHMCTYRPDLISRYARLSAVLEMDVSLAQQAQREAFSDEEVNGTRDRVDRLNSLQQSLDRSWKGTRWIMDLITFARDKSSRGGIPCSMLDNSSNDAFSPKINEDNVFDNNNSHPSCGSAGCDSNEISVGKDNRKIAKFYDPNEEVSKNNGHVQKESSHSSSGILQVYVAYETGLSKGTRVRLHVTEKTTAREVVTLVVKQLNKAVTSKGKSGPIYGEDELDKFCLVAVIGARERILRDDYHPLQLQNPWTKGKLYVRMKRNLLAAIQQGHATEV
ncbi:ankyrin repeat and fibronectin type-III domain-containing protein 1-like isoform X3 [Mytilus californianus]|uniref:ankyrin repeat and fibronectin type-III domain-containing protein 1-like isoform X3 n=1 Tax=Mytilus californianus TaxID=6549 RepID=UPI002245354F|nr:ankyrin repeat and fibronectin type-III domain-containing protein 1-like isoform X3 [Mytilus californianus]